MPDGVCGIICACILAIACTASPRPFQIFTIFCMVVLKDQFTYLIHENGEGKSLVFPTTPALLCGATIVMVPLIDLGRDQVNQIDQPGAMHWGVSWWWESWWRLLEISKSSVIDQNRRQARRWFDHPFFLRNSMEITKTTSSSAFNSITPSGNNRWKPRSWLDGLTRVCFSEP